MNILITGATGFIGRALTLRLLRDGHHVVAWVRSAKRARDTLGAEVELIEAPSEATPAICRAVSEADAVINLGGAPVMGGRWTKKRRRLLISSRVELTRAVVDAIRASDRRPAVLISASAIGYYGVRPEGELDEDAEAADDFLAQLCVRWEAEALEAEPLGVRVVLPRLGIVLGSGGGALSSMLPPFRARVGGRIGSGEQPMSWIHLDDLLDAITHALDDGSMRGPINAVAPQPVTNAAFTRALGEQLDRPTLLPVPGLVLRAIFGEAASLLLGGQRVAPRRLEEAGFEFRFPALAPALEDILDAPGVCFSTVDSDTLPDAAYLRERPPRYLLSARVVIDAPIAEVFAFFSQAENLGAITPPDMQFSIETPTPIDMVEGARIDYRIRLGPIPMRWTTRIEVWEDGARFVDAQLRGPYSSWFHEHRFTPDGERTIMEDRVFYSIGFGPFGRLAHALFVRSKLEHVFAHRTFAIRHRFGDSPTDPANAVSAPRAQRA